MNSNILIVAGLTEPIAYFGAGVLLAALISAALPSFLRRRAMRLAEQRLQIKSDSSPDVAPSLCTSAGVESRSASHSGRSVPVARKSYRTRAAAERQ
jgi:hypothetical protein